MATIRKFCCNDLLRFTSVNLDHLATTIEMSFYLTCLAKRSCYFFHAAVAPGNRIIGYMIGKTEKEPKGGEESEGEEEFEESEGERRERLEHELWKTLDDLAKVENAASDSEEEESEGGHWQGLAVTVHVAPEYRRLGYATRLMGMFEKHLVEKMLLSPRDREYYTFLHVVNDNTPAKLFFEQCGYEVTRITNDFYMNDDDEEIDSYEMRKVLSEGRRRRRSRRINYFTTVDQLRSLRKCCITKLVHVNVNVASEYRRRGYGMRLIRLFEQLLVDKMLLSPRDCEYYTFVHVDCENTPAKNMFKQLGYEIIDYLKPDDFSENKDVFGEVQNTIHNSTLNPLGH